MKEETGIPDGEAQRAQAPGAVPPKSATGAASQPADGAGKAGVHAAEAGDGQGAASTAAAAGAPDARSRNGELDKWRGPAFWMTCGALLAGLAVAAAVIVHRVGVERDIAALSGTLPPAMPAQDNVASDTQPGSAPSGPGAASAPADVPLAATDGRTETAAGAGITPAAPSVQGQALRAPRVASSSRGGRAGQAAPRYTLKAEAKSVRPGVRKAATKQRIKRQSARKYATAPAAYSNVFKRCPYPGEAGAVECRRHICNGAESEGAACRPYRGRMR